MQPQLPPLTPTVRTLVVAWAVTFLGQTILEGMMGVPLTSWAALQPGLHLGVAWQWATYWLFANPTAPIWHLFSVFVAYLTLAPFEQVHGARRLVGLVAAGVIAGALPVWIVGTVLPAYVGWLIGPSTLFFAALGTMFVMRPDAQMGFFFVGLPPVSMRTMIGVLVALSAIESAWSHDASALLSCLGALGGGIAYARWIGRVRRPVPSGPPKKRAGRPNLTVIEGGASDDDKPRWLN